MWGRFMRRTVPQYEYVNGLQGWVLNRSSCRDSSQPFITSHNTDILKATLSTHTPPQSHTALYRLFFKWKSIGLNAVLRVIINSASWMRVFHVEVLPTEGTSDPQWPLCLCFHFAKQHELQKYHYFFLSCYMCVCFPNFADTQHWSFTASHWLTGPQLN